MLKRYNSSPSLVSSSCDGLDGNEVDARDSLSESIVVQVNKHEFVQPLSNPSSPLKTNGTKNGKVHVSESPKKIAIRNAKGIEIDPGAVNLSPSSVSSNASSFSCDEVAELPNIRKVRGHTVSIVQPSKDSQIKDEVLGLKSKVSGVKDTGRGGVNPSFVFLQLYHGGALHHSNDVPILLPQTEVYNTLLLRKYLLYTLSYALSRTV